MYVEWQKEYIHFWKKNAYIVVHALVWKWLFMKTIIRKKYFNERINLLDSRHSLISKCIYSAVVGINKITKSFFFSFGNLQKNLFVITCDAYLLLT